VQCFVEDPTDEQMVYQYKGNELYRTDYWPSICAYQGYVEPFGLENWIDDNLKQLFIRGTTPSQQVIKPLQFYCGKPSYGNNVTIQISHASFH